MRSRVLEISADDLAEILSAMNHPHIYCISTSCKYRHPMNKSGCALGHHVVLREGICRYYTPGTMEDRTDLPGGNYMKFIAELRNARGCQETDQAEAQNF